LGGEGSECGFCREETGTRGAEVGVLVGDCLEAEFFLLFELGELFEAEGFEIDLFGLLLLCRRLTHFGCIFWATGGRWVEMEVEGLILEFFRLLFRFLSDCLGTN